MTEEKSILKAKIRKEMLSKLNSLHPSERDDRSLKIQLRVLDSAVFKKSKSIALYSSYENEVSTQLIFKEGRKDKKIAYPKVIKEAGALDFFWVSDLNQMKVSHWGLLEPDPKNSLGKAQASEIDLMIIPGLAFDDQGRRLGRGQGFYDRILSKFSGLSLGIAYSFQLLKILPEDAWDRSMDYLALEDQFFQF